MSSSPPSWRRLSAVFSLLLPLLAPAPAQADFFPTPWLDVPYVTSTPDVVDAMLRLAKVGRNDMVYDLGCGDGRIVIAAARNHGARGVGIDLDPERIADARENARSAGVEDRVRFRTRDLFKEDFSDATVVMLYLFPQINQKLRPQLWRQLKVGTRVVSNSFDMGPEWPAEKIERVGDKTIYYWTIRSEHKKAVR